MRSKAVSLILLMSLFLNIAHATVISYAESCDHEKICEYVMEMEQGSECGDLCDMHHMFHLNAIPAASVLLIPRLDHSIDIGYNPIHYLPPYLEQSYRPPII